MSDMKWTYAFLVISLTYQSYSNIAKVCGPFDYNCGDGNCIPDHLVCDGKADCFNRTDELHEICEKIHCPSYSFRCSYGACIDSQNLCNGRKDCLDGSDELTSNCAFIEDDRACPLDSFHCRSGECLSSEKACDGVADCGDLSDEEEALCLKSFCPKYAFRCRYGACISRDFCCNGEIDCADGSDEDSRLCGEYRNVPITELNVTESITIPGSCKLPARNDMRFISAIFQEEYEPGTYVTDGEVIEVMCVSGLAMNVSLIFDYTNSCSDTKWSRKWSIFPECQTICSGADVTGRTIKSICEFNGKNIPCNQQHLVGTIAYLECGAYYDMPKETSHLSKKLTCLSSGSWDKLALRCKPRCGRVTQRSTAYVVGGRKAKNVAEVPWAAAIYKGNILICGGTIMSERLVVTAAHCFFRELDSGQSETVVLEDIELFKVAVGKYFRDFGATEDFAPQFLNIAEVISVPGYDGYVGFFSADFAVLVLDDFIIFRPHILPICVDKNNYLAEETEVATGLNGTVAGWGFTTAGGSPSDFLKIAKLPTVQYNKCKRDAPQNFKQFVTPDKFCAGNLNGGDAVCQGDSGSGLVFPQIENDEEVFFLRGIVSNARQVEGACDLNFYTMFTNVDNYMRYINSAEKRFPSS